MEDNINNGYKTKEYKVPTKRYCQTMDLRNDPQMIEEYVRRHKNGIIWKEVPEGIKSVGILEMEIYIYETKLFMIVETAMDFDWDSAMEKLSTLPRQQEWEDYITLLQTGTTGAKATEKWKRMERIFHLYE